jgi:hypothetical protein
LSRARIRENLVDLRLVLAGHYSIPLRKSFTE